MAIDIETNHSVHTTQKGDHGDAHEVHVLVGPRKVTVVIPTSDYS